MIFKINDIIKSSKNMYYHYVVCDYIIWNDTQIMKIKPLELSNSNRDYPINIVVVNDEIIDLFSKIGEK